MDRKQAGWPQKKKSQGSGPHRRFRSVTLRGPLTSRSQVGVRAQDLDLYLMLVLPILFYLLFLYLPIFGNVIAFRRFQPGGSVIGTHWVGFKYFRMFLQDATFWKVFRNTFLLAVGSIGFGFPFPIAFALMLNELRARTFKKIVQTTAYLPHFLSSVVVCGMIIEVLSPGSGIINKLIGMTGGKPIAFLQQAEWFRPVYIISGIWQSMGWNAIIYLAALSHIDPQLYEAAQMDGANRWKQIWHVTLPGIAPTIVITLILAVGGMMNIGFEKVLLLYNPGTYETADVLGTYVFRMGLQNANFSYATAVGLFEALIGLFLVASANRVSRSLTETSLW